MKQPPWKLSNNQLTISCHVQPGAKQTRLAGLHDDRLKIQLKAPPIDGKANKLLIDFLSDICARPRSDVSIQRGKGSRFKFIRINGIQRIPEKIINLYKE